MALAVSTAMGTGSGTITVPQPSGFWNSGNLLILAFVQYLPTSYASITGWGTVVQEGITSTQQSTQVYAQVLTSAGPSSYSFSSSSTSSAIIVEYTGVSGIDVSTVNNSSSSTNDAPVWNSITPSAANEIICLICGNRQRTMTTWPTGYTQEVSETGTSGHAAVMLADAQQSGQSATGSLSGLLSGNAPWTTVTLALTPSGGGFPFPPFPVYPIQIWDH